MAYFWGPSGGPTAGDRTPAAQTPTNQDNMGDLWNQIFNTPAPDVASQNPLQDARYNAWYRGMGLQNSLINANVNRDNTNLQSQLEAQRPMWADTLSQGLQKIGNNNEANGVYNSGERLNQQNQFQVGQERAQNAFEGNIANQEANNTANAQAQMLDLARQDAEQRLNAQQGLAQQQLAGSTNPVMQELMQQLMGSING